MSYGIIKIDPYLAPFEDDIRLRSEAFKRKSAELFADKSITDFANGHHYFGFHKEKKGFVFREWAPGADSLYLCGDFNGWELFANPMKRLENGVFELTSSALKEGQYAEVIVVKGDEVLRRVPSYATRVVQDKDTHRFCAQIEDVFAKFSWEDEGFKPPKTLFIYECHIGMSGEEGRIHTYTEFKDNVLPKVKKLGYNALQIMAIMEHPYYGSFGYQVSNFFAPSTKFGSSTELKELINEAHKIGIAVFLDLVHSHAVKNEGEGLFRFDGTDYQYFHSGGRGNHPTWDTKLFDYGKNEVIHFLLSNLKYWLEVFHFDGFRFDGVTSMLYHDHGLGSAFLNYNMHFSLNTDIDAVTYLTLASKLVHEVNKNAVIIAEDMSGMPGMCLPISAGGIGFDYRLSMGVPDMWVRLLEGVRDEDWNLGHIWHELTFRRPKEKTICYAESHDQALVGDKTIMFRLCDADMYFDMKKSSGNAVIDRGMALHKMIRLVTASLGGEGYLNFMGNEFGHPEWIDFPREGNGFSYHYCRRQWSLAENSELRYSELLEFDKAMVSMLKRYALIKKEPELIKIHEDDKILAFSKGEKVFIFNFHPEKSFDGYFINAKSGKKYRVVLDTDEEKFGGFSRVSKEVIYTAKNEKGLGNGFRIYLPQRTAMVLECLP